MLTLIITAYAIVTMIMLFIRLEWGLIMLIPLLPVATYTYRSPVTGLNTINLLIYPAFAMGLLRRMGDRDRGLPPATIPLVAFFALTLVGWVMGALTYKNQPAYDVYRKLINFERWVLYTLLYFAFYFGWTGRYSVWTAFKWMFAGIAIAAVSNLVELVHPGEYYRITHRTGAIFQQANSNGIFLATYAFLGLALARRATSKVGRWFCYGIFVVCLQGILLSASRTGLIAFVAASLVYAWNRSKRGFAVIVMLLIVMIPLYSVVLPEPVVMRIEQTTSGSRYEGVAGKLESSTANRVVQNIAAYHMFMDSPILGHGLGGFYYESPKYLPANAPDVARSAHTTFAWIIVELGIVALFVFIWFLWSIAREGLLMYRNSTDEATRLLGLYLFVAMVAKVLANFVSTDLLTGDVSTYLWISAALITWKNQYEPGTAPTAAPARAASRPRVSSVWRPRSSSSVASRTIHG